MSKSRPRMKKKNRSVSHRFRKRFKNQRWSWAVSLIYFLTVNHEIYKTIDNIPKTFWSNSTLEASKRCHCFWRVEVRRLTISRKIHKELETPRVSLQYRDPKRKPSTQGSHNKSSMLQSSMSNLRCSKVSFKGFSRLPSSKDYTSKLPQGSPYYNI